MYLGIPLHPTVIFQMTLNLYLICVLKFKPYIKFIYLYRVYFPLILLYLYFEFIIHIQITVYVFHIR